MAAHCAFPEREGRGGGERGKRGSLGLLGGGGYRNLREVWVWARKTEEDERKKILSGN